MSPLHNHAETLPHNTKHLVSGHPPSPNPRQPDKLRYEGLAERYVEINGVWEDHRRFAITEEEWRGRAPDLIAEWIAPLPVAEPSAQARSWPRGA